MEGRREKTQSPIFQKSSQIKKSPFFNGRLFLRAQYTDLALVSCAHLFASQTIKKKLQCLRIIIGKLWKEHVNYIRR